jgi:hypothetical protein
MEKKEKLETKQKHRAIKEDRGIDARVTSLREEEKEKVTSFRLFVCSSCPFAAAARNQREKLSKSQTPCALHHLNTVYYSLILSLTDCCRV